MRTKFAFLKKITNILGIALLMLGFVPVPIISQVSPVYASVQAEDSALVDFTSYNSLLGSPGLSCEGDACTPDVVVEEEVPVEETVGEEVVPAESDPIVEVVVQDESTSEEGSSSGSQESAEQIGDESSADTSEESNIQSEVNALASADAVLLDENNEPIPLTSEEALDTISSADPYFYNLSEKYCYLHVGETPAGDCDYIFFSSTPIQDAIDAAAGAPPDDGTIYVEPGIYEENVTIHIEGLTLYGDPGDLLLAGAGEDAPVLQGGFGGDTGVGVTITAQGATIMGFIIQGFEIGILGDAASGNIAMEVLNNTIRNNDIGVKNEGATGKPKLDVHYNLFQNNIIALDNNSTIEGTSVNVQYVEAQNNNWGCPEGPVVYDESEGEYYLWSTKQVIDYPTEYGECALLDGVSSLWDHQFNTPDWSPFKINLGNLADQEPYCGDGIVNGNEQCELGDENCTKECIFEEQPEIADLDLSLVCLGVGQFAWSVTNPNDFVVINVQVQIDGNLVFDGSIPANATIGVGTSTDGPESHDMVVTWAEEGYAATESDQVCRDTSNPPPQDPPIPVSGANVLIPVTGLDLTQASVLFKGGAIAAGISMLGLSFGLGKKRKEK